VPDNPPLERTAAAVYFNCGRASRVRRRGRSTALRYSAEATPMPASDVQLTEWAESCLRINHLNTLIQREIAAQKLERASQLSHRAQQRAWKLLNEMFAAGASKPDGYCEPEAAE